MQTKDNFQNLFKAVTYLAGGVFVMGGIMDAITNSISVFNQNTALYISISIVLIYIVLYNWLKINKPYWGTGNNKVRIIKPNIKIKLFFIGMLLTIWVPQFLRPLIISPSTDDAKNKINNSELIFEEEKFTHSSFDKSIIKQTNLKEQKISKTNLYRSIITNYENNQFNLSNDTKKDIEIEFDVSNLTDDEYLGYVIAAYYAVGMKSKAIELIMQRDISIPNWNYHLIVDLIYCLPDKNQDRIEKIKELRSKHRSKILSYVWAVTDPNTIYDVFNSQHNERNIRKKGSKEYTEIKEVIKLYPKDPFLDFAYYLIGEYQLAIDYNPVSRFSDIYLFALYKEGFRKNLPKKSEFIPGLQENLFKPISNKKQINYINKKINNLKNYLENYGNTFHRFDMCFYLGWLELKLDHKKEAYIWFEKAKTNSDIEFIQTIQISILNKLSLKDQIYLIEQRNIIEQSKYSEYYLSKQELLFFIDKIVGLPPESALQEIRKTTDINFIQKATNSYLKRLIDIGKFDHFSNTLNITKTSDKELFSLIDKT